MSAVRRLAPLLGLVLLLSACGASTGPAGPSGTPSNDLRCPDSPALLRDVTTSGHQPQDAVALGRDEQVLAVVECTLTEKDYPGEGAWQVVTELHAAAGLDALVAALRAPGGPSGAAACIQPLFVEPWFGLVLADGRFVRPVVPLDGCGHPLPAVRAALDALAWTQVSLTRLAQVRTQAQVDLEAEATAQGCTTAFKDLLARYDQDRKGLTAPTRSGPVGLGPTTTVSVCRMRAGSDPIDPVLEFVSGERRSGAALEALRAALLESSAPAAPCTRAAARQVVLLPGNGSYVVVELDGCQRVLAQQAHETLTQASPMLLAALS